MTHPSRARTNDPYTSHAAAEVATKHAPTVRATVLRLLTEAGEPLTFDQLIGRYRQAAMLGKASPRTSESAIRTQCKYLADDAEVIVVPDGIGRSRLGNRARLHCAASVYPQWLARLSDGAA